MSNEAAIASLKKVIETDPKNALKHNELGNLYYEDRRIEEAKACYTEAIALNPNLPVYYENLGLMNEELACWPEAADAYEKAVALNPTWNLYNFLGIAYYRMKKFEAAIINYKKAIDLNKTEPPRSDADASKRSGGDLYNNLGLAYEGAGDKLKEAEEAYLQAVNIEPDNYNFLNMLGVFYALQKRHEEAVDYFKRAIDLGKGEAVLFENIGLSLESLNR